MRYILSNGEWQTASRAEWDAVADSHTRAVVGTLITAIECPVVGTFDAPLAYSLVQANGIVAEELAKIGVGR